MKPSGPTFWRIGGLTGWQDRTAKSDLAVSDRHGLRLSADSNGPLALDSDDGALGGLTLPRGMAFDRSARLHLLADAGTRVKRYDRETRTFQDLQEVGGEGTEPRRFSGAKSIAIACDWLYVVDEVSRRVQVFDADTLALIDIVTAPRWTPIDVATGTSGAVYILDGKHGRVFRHTRDGHLALYVERKERAGAWTRVAVDREGELYMLDAKKRVLDRRDPKLPPVADAGAVRDRFDTPAIRLDAQGRFSLSPPKKKQQQKPALPAARGAWLWYVVRRNEHRVDAYTGDGRRLRHSWGACMDWQPCDVTASGEHAFILDERGQAVYRHTAGRENLKPLLQGDAARRHWSRIAAGAGTVYLREEGAAKVQVFDCSGSPRGEKAFTAVAALFDPKRRTAPPSFDDPLFFDRDGNRAGAPTAPDSRRLYKREGEWRSKPLDSGIYRCSWHRIELDLTSFPPGTSISVATCAHEQPEDVDDARLGRFVEASTFVAPISPDDAMKPRKLDMLVQSGGGRYLSIAIKLRGDAFSTPAADIARVHYPRESYLQYLPATFSADDESRLFLERFLSIFQTDWDAFESVIDASERFFDPESAPPAFVEYLAAQWLDLPLEAEWNDEQKRRLVAAAPKIYPHRGQVSGLRDFLAVYLANLSGLEIDDVRALGFPGIVEGFQEREQIYSTAGLGAGPPLWSASVRRRLQLGVYSTVGEADLVSTGNPERDFFDEFAHRFRVYMPAAWVPDGAAERMIRRALDAEKPAHTTYELCLVEPRFRLDAQSTVGVDTIIGAEPSLRLGCNDCRDLPEALPPAGRLGYDAVLAAREPKAGLP